MLPSQLWSLLERFDDATYTLRHPSMRRCPECRLTWEGREHMDRHGKCHDCVSNDLMLEIDL